MKKLMLSSLLAILTLAASAQTNTYAMVIEMQNGTKLTIGPNEVKNVTFNNGQLTVTGETIETLVGSAVDQAKAYTDQAAANLKGYIDLANQLANLEGRAADKADVAKLQSDLAALARQVSENTVGQSDYKEAITKLTSDLGALKGDLEQQVAFLGEHISDNTAAITSLTADGRANKEAQDKTNEAIKGDVAKNAQNIIANGKNTEALQKFIPELEASLEKYADKVAATAAQAGKDAASNAQAMAQNYALDQIKMQATMDKEAWSKAIDISIESLVKTYQLNAMKEIISSEINAAIVNLIQTYNLQKQ